DGGMSVTQQVDRDAGHHIQVLLPLVVPGDHALSLHEGDRKTLEGAHEVGVLGIHQLLRRHAVTMVPIPASVNSSSSRECATRPSMTCACGTLSSERRQASSLGIMPPLTTPSVISRPALSRLSSLTTWPLASR